MGDDEEEVTEVKTIDYKINIKMADMETSMQVRHNIRTFFVVAPGNQRRRIAAVREPKQWQQAAAPNRTRDSRRWMPAAEAGSSTLTPSAVVVLPF